MKKASLFFVSLFFLSRSLGQTQVLPKIMVIPYTRDKEDIRTILDDDVNRRIAITKVKEGFDSKGFTTVDFLGKLKAAKDNQIFTSDNQTDVKSKIIELSGCDEYVVVEVDPQNDNSGASVNVILSSYEVATGNSLANKVGSSGKFYTDDYGKLTSRAVEKCIDEFVTTMNQKYSEVEKNGHSVLVDFSFSEGSTVTMKAEIAQYKKMALSDVLEDWISKNSVKGNYHIQGTTNLKMIFDDIKIPTTDTDGNNYNANKYALKIRNFLSSIGISASKEIKSNTIYITIN